MLKEIAPIIRKLTSERISQPKRFISLSRSLEMKTQNHTTI
jgi:hypothetical protein